jgi:Ca2+-binding RTX toxin-like protein
VVQLHDRDGNPVNALFTDDGTYTFDRLYVDPEGSTSTYVVQFELPEGYQFVSPAVGAENADSDVVAGGRTAKYSISTGTTSITDVDAGLRSADAEPMSSSGYFEFDNPYQDVSELDPAGLVEIVVVRGSATERRAVVVRTIEEAGGDAAVEGTNFTAHLELLVFEIGEAVKLVEVPILNSGLLDFCTTKYFTVELREPTGRPLDSTTVTIYGEGAGTITDDDHIEGGGDWDIILGDSGMIPGYAVVNNYDVIDDPQYLGDIVRVGGPGKDLINAGDGADYIDGQLGDDVLAGNRGLDIVIGGMGDDEIVVELDDDDLRGDHGDDVVVSSRDVARVALVESAGDPTDPSHILTHENSQGMTLSTFRLWDEFELAKLLGGYQDNTFDLTGWGGSALVSGDLVVSEADPVSPDIEDDDTLLITKDTDITVADAGLLECLLFGLTLGFVKDGSVSLASGECYNFGGIENVSVTGGPGDNTIDASLYSGPVTLAGMGGDDILIGGSNDDVFSFDVDGMLGVDTVTGNGGADTLDFTGSSAGVEVDLADLDPIVQTAAATLDLRLVDLIENATGGEGNDTLRGNALDNVLRGGPGDDELEGRAGSETYVFDTDDADWGEETIIESAADAGIDTVDFSPTSDFSITVDFTLTGVSQAVNANLDLIIEGEGFEIIKGGAQADTITGNSASNHLFGGPGADQLFGVGGDDFLAGEAGNDLLDGGDGTDLIREEENTDFYLTDGQLVRGSGEVDVLVDIERAELSGGAAANLFDLRGWTGLGSIDGKGHVDTVKAAADADITLSDIELSVSTSLGPITLTSIELADLAGGVGDNTLDASSFTKGPVSLAGGLGADTLRGGTRGDLLDGGEGDDVLTGNEGDDVVIGGAGVDTQDELRDANRFVAQSGRLEIELLGGYTEIDTLWGVENLILRGGPSANEFDVSSWVTGNLELRGEGADDIVVASGEGTIEVTDSLISIPGGIGSIGLDSIEIAWLTGSDEADTIDASGFTGTTRLRGLGGADIFIGGPGDDVFEGGSGDDVFSFDADGPLGVDEVSGGAGVDTLNFSGTSVATLLNLSTIGVVQSVVAGVLDVTLQDAIENVIGGSDVDTLTGNGLDNTFTGGPGADQFDGQGGLDRVLEEADADFVLTGVSLDIAGEIDTLLSIEAATLIGGPGDNDIDATLFGGSTVLDGRGGVDTLRGGLGRDRFILDTDVSIGATRILDAGGRDTLDFSGTTDLNVKVDLALNTLQTVNGNLELLILLGTTIENVVATENDDVILGNAASNFFWGGRGADTFDGRLGFDWVFEERDADFVLQDDELSITELGGDGVPELDTLIDIEGAALTGGDGDNIIDASSFTGQTQLRGRAGNDDIFGGLIGSNSLYGGDGFDYLVGGNAADTIRGGPGDDSLFGNGGNDILFGNGMSPLSGFQTDRDVLAGGVGDDTLRGNEQNDVYVFDLSEAAASSDTIFEDVGEGYQDVIVGALGNALDLAVSLPQNLGDGVHFVTISNLNVELSL